jgi:hypothetical protein
MRLVAMPLFFFHLREGGHVTRDEEGRELPDRRAAHAVAVMSARDIMCGELMLGHVDLTDSIAVEDEKGESVFELPFSEAVEFAR